MKKLWKKIFLSIVSLLLVLSTLATSTYAWMTLNSEAWVEGINFTATGGEGFSISIDGYNFKNQLVEEDIYKAVIAEYKEYDFSESGDLIDSQGNLVKGIDLSEVIKEIKLEPITSINNLDGNLPLSDLVNQEIKATDGKHFEFSVYFKRVDTSESAKAMEIYLNGEERYLAEQKVPKTAITSALEDINLKTALECIERNIPYGDKVSYQGGEKITVSSANAMRLGVVHRDVETVIELVNEYDLGSYATDYDKANSTDPEKEKLDKLYNAEHNAMYTYYNRLKGNSLKKLSYNVLPDHHYNSLLNERNENQILLCRLDGNEAVKVSFKLWLEGWDADCFDGIGEQISVQLSFVQKVESYNN